MAEWKPNYTMEFKKRLEALEAINKDPILKMGALEHYKDNPIDFINDWTITFDPRNAGSDIPVTMPLILFPKQEDLVRFLLSCIEDGEGGLIEKARDMGATWVCCAFSVWLFLFKDGASIGWGSRKQEYVDKLGEMDSIFEKIRAIINNLPVFFLPKGFDSDKHMNFMRILNPETGGSISGEAGDNIGRGGRKTLYFKDESSHYERPELIEAALGDNTDVQIDISSVNGTGNVFYRRRQNGVMWTDDFLESLPRGKTRIFIMAWEDHPNKTQEWYDRRRARADEEGLLHLFKQEVDRDYTGAIENLVIKAEWVVASIDAHKKLGFEIDGKVYAGLDVADGGADMNALAIRKGQVLGHVSSWSEGDTYDTAIEALQGCVKFKVQNLGYDSIGVGAGVKAAFNKLDRPARLDVSPWCASAKCLKPERRMIEGDRESPKNKDFYLNLKSQGWWELRNRFKRTYDAVIHGREVDLDATISIPSNLPKRHELVTELSQPTFSHNAAGKLIIDKTPEGTRSPNLADAVMMAFHPIERSKFFA